MIKRKSIYMKDLVSILIFTGLDLLSEKEEEILKRYSETWFQSLFLLD